MLNGPNLDLLGTCEIGFCGEDTLEDLEERVWVYGEHNDIEVKCFQSNTEGRLIDQIHKVRGKYDGIVCNPGALAHYSYALRDAIASAGMPCVEVHLLDAGEGEDFRRSSVTAPVCVALVRGRGIEGYCEAIDILMRGDFEGCLGDDFDESPAAGQVIIAGKARKLAAETAGAAAMAAEPMPAEDAGAMTVDAAAVAAAAAAAAAPELVEAAADEPAAASFESAAGEPEGLEEDGDSASFAQPGAAGRRIARLRKACEDAGLDAYLACNTSDIEWLTAFDGVFDEEEAHVLLVTPDAAMMHTDMRYSNAARRAAAAEGVVEVDDSVVSHVKYVAAAVGGENEEERQVAESAEKPADLGEQLAQAEHDAACNDEISSDRCVLGIENAMTIARYTALTKAMKEQPHPAKMQATSGFVLALRAVKEPSEIKRLKAAQAITDAAFDHIIGFIRVGMTEREVQIELEDYMRRHGADGLAFSSIVATGENGASPHAIPGSTRLEAGQCVVMDFGAKAYGYCSDMTRTVFLGEPDERLRDAYAAIRAANETVEATLKPGVTGKAMHELAEQILADAGYGGKMGHSLGHGVGIDIHEEPLLAPRNDKPLCAGSVITVEPGVYLPGEFGMRLEDCGVLTEEGYEPFGRSTHEMVIL